MKRIFIPFTLGVCLLGSMAPLSWAISTAKPFHLPCLLVEQSSDAAPAITTVLGTAYRQGLFSPTDVMLTVALNQRYQQHYQIMDIHRAIQKSKVKKMDVFYPKFIELKTIIEYLGYSAKGYRLTDIRNEIQVGDVGFLIDTQARFDQTPVITLLFASTESKRYLLYGDGFVCPMEKTRFDQYFHNKAFLRLE
ncbi:hypothetical protein [Acinetobacter sp. Ac_5812]|uniref:hypothetical protein n=1 Tax=Acinetobacter sp. Ac_5812 TaxID=1848937 RepID=UPI00149037EE|nr:hypothetical protein [Acinetobacter sp. Ac_5812]NNP67968.1 hypothetical protein [Acinetobacter sp. Ac_5812]